MLPPGISVGPLDLRFSDQGAHSRGRAFLVEIRKAFIHPFGGSFTPSFIPTRMHLSVHVFIHSFTPAYVIHLCINLLVHSETSVCSVFVHSRTYLLNHQFTQPLTYSFILLLLIHAMHTFYHRVHAFTFSYMCLFLHACTPPSIHSFPNSFIHRYVAY